MQLPMNLRLSLLDLLRAEIADQRPCDVPIGGAEDTYIRRWHVVEKNDRQNIYLHQQLRDDDDRALHDHPWDNVSVILEGGYVEMMPDPQSGEIVSVTRRPGDVIFRPAAAAHRLVLPRREGRVVPSWSLFLTGPKLRDWGFLCPKGWTHHRDFCDDSGLRAGKGCD